MGIGVLGLRGKPIRVPFEEYLRDVQGHEQLRQEAYKLPVVENKLTNEPLVKLTEFGVANFSFELEHYSETDALRLVGRELPVSPQVWVRKTVAEMLVKVDNILRKADMFLLVRSGYRHPDVQRLAYLLAREKAGKKFARSRFAIEKDLVGSESVFPHATGGVVDVEIWQRGCILGMKALGVPIQTWDLEVFFSGNGKYKALKELLLGRLDGKIIPEWKNYMKSRRLLYHVMKDGGFYPLMSEYWHWGFGDHLSYVSAKLLGEGSYRPWYREAKFPD